MASLIAHATKLNGIAAASFFAVLLATFFAISPVSHAATGLTIQPIKIDQTMQPGDTSSGSITLTNASDGPVNVQISKQDFTPVAGADSIQFVGRAQGATSVIDWVSIGTTTTLSLKKNETRQIPYTITVPASAEPGSHFGVMLFNATPKIEGGGSIKVGTQVGVLVLIAVPGNHLQNGKILDLTAPWFVTSGPVPFSIKFQNTGTVHFEPKGSIVISSMFGAKIADVPIDGQVVLPTSVRVLREQWDVSGLLLGRYTATATITDSDGNALTSATTTFWAFPIWYGVSFLVTLILLFFLIRFLRRRVRISFTSR